MSESKILLTSSTPPVGIGAPVGSGKGKVQFSVGEEEMIEGLRTQFGITYIEAVDQVIKYKYEQVIYHENQGTELGKKMADQIRRELGESV